MSRATKILLVDDETGILDTLRILFRGEGYDATPGLPRAAVSRRAASALFRRLGELRCLVL